MIKKTLFFLTKSLVLVILCAFFGLATLTGGSILSESYEHLEEFQKLEKSNLLNNLPSGTSEYTKDLISLYHNSAAYSASIESDKIMLYAFLILFVITSIVTLKFFITNIIRKKSE